MLTDDVDYVDTWKGMEECVKLGLVKSIGISNFNSEQINRVLKAATIKPAVNQVINISLTYSVIENSSFQRFQIHQVRKLYRLNTLSVTKGT